MSIEYSILANREVIDDTAAEAYEITERNFSRAQSLAQSSAWLWGEHASYEDYSQTSPIDHQLTGELPILPAGYRTSEYHNCSNTIAKELFPDFSSRVYAATNEYVEQALTPGASREERLIALDFAKQYALTIFHAAQYPARTEYLSEEEMVPQMRLGEAARLLTRAFYLDVLGHDAAIIDQEVQQARDILTDDAIRSEVIELPPEHFKEQELDQPLTIIAASLLAVADHPDTSFIYALPAGGTQHAIVSQLLFMLRSGSGDKPILDYLPISTHSSSAKQPSGSVSPAIETIMMRHDLRNEHVLICEDNSNTGTTLSLATDVVAASSPASVSISAVELDPRRLVVKNRNPEPSTMIANYTHPDFSTSVGIVPITTGRYPDFQLRKIAALRRVLRHSHESSDNRTNLTYDDIPEGLLEEVEDIYLRALRHCGDTYGYRNPYQVGAYFLRNYEGETPIKTGVYEDDAKVIFRLANAATRYPYLPGSTRELLESSTETLDYTPNGSWIRAGAQDFMREVVQYAKEADSKAILWTKGDASYYSNPPYVGMEEQAFRYKLSGLERAINEVGFTASGRGEFVAHPKKVALLKTSIFPALISQNKNITDVLIVDDSEKNLAEAALQARLFNLRPHLVNPLDRNTGRANLAELTDMARARAWGQNVAFIIDMDDTLLHEGFRKYHQPRNISLALLSATR